MSGEYLIDDKVRLLDSSQDSEGLSGVNGINYLRQKLLKNNSSIRLVGLSGVGKTRFAHALFDARIGENPLSSENIFYTDIANGPSPSAGVLAEKLVSEGKDVQLIVDNCPPDLHRSLTSICASEASKVSLLTIEYDIREDQPEQTEVFSLEPSSTELIEKILNARYRNLGQQNSRTISEFSGGNSRIAIALAETIEKDENISSLKDEELFKRLFHQRHDQDKSLEKIAQTLSLVYSFQINSDNSYSDDVVFMSKLSEISPKNIYEAAIELKRRSLVQQRSKWMAVLPHPVANRLAKNALENIGPGIILSNFNEATDERLLKSFSRRLGYLPHCNEAKIIVERWFSESGLLEKLHSNNRNDLAWIVIGNIAPISAKEVLAHIEKLAGQPEFCTRNNRKFTEITRLIRVIAYEEKFFNQCANLLCQFALSESKGENCNSIRSILKSLFQLCLSGTHATKEQRLKVIDDLINTRNESDVELALVLLESALEARSFSSVGRFDFGANPRDSGYRPKTNQDVEDWYGLFINYTAKLIFSSSSHSNIAKEILGRNVGGLWQQSSLRDLIEETCLKVGGFGVWNDGFSAIHGILKWDCKYSDDIEISRLKSIAEKLSPKSLLDEIHRYVLTDEWAFHDLDEFDDDGELIERGRRKAQEYSRELGSKILITDADLFELLLFELLSYSGSNSNLFEFGQGCAEGVQDNADLLAMTISTLEKIPEEEHSLNLLCGQLKYLSECNTNLAGAFLDSLIIHPTLKRHFVQVQLSCTLNSEAVVRIIQSLKKNTSPAFMYMNLPLGGRHEVVPDDQLCDILGLIWQKDGGQEVVINLLSKYFHCFELSEGRQVSDSLKVKSASFLASLIYPKERNGSNFPDGDLSQIANVCFSNHSNKEYAISVFDNAKSNMLTHTVGLTDFPGFLSTMVQMHPTLALDEFIGDGLEVGCQMRKTMNDRLDNRISPFSNIDTKAALAWCENNKYPILASIITPYRVNKEAVEWTSLAIDLLISSPEPIKVLDAYLSSFSSSGCTSSRAKVFESRLPLFGQLKVHDDKEISSWALNQEALWKRCIASEYKYEEEREIDGDERFEW